MCKPSPNFQFPTPKAFTLTTGWLVGRACALWELGFGSWVLTAAWLPPLGGSVPCNHSGLASLSDLLGAECDKQQHNSRDREPGGCQK